MIATEIESQEFPCEKLRSLEVLIYWACDFESPLQANGVPFDLKWVHCYERLITFHKSILQLRDKNPAQHGTFYKSRLLSLCNIFSRFKHKNL